MKNVMQRLGMPEDMPIENKLISSSIEKAQVKVEGNNFDIRKHLVEYDDVINKQRGIIYRKRKEILDLAKDKSIKLKENVQEMIAEEIEEIVSFHAAGDDQSQWNLQEIGETVKTIFPISPENLEKIKSLEKIAGDKYQDAVARTNIIDFLTNLAKEEYERLEKYVHETAGDENYMRVIDKEILIRSIDNLWIDHLDAISVLRTGIGLRGYGQLDPLVEYKRETYQMFLQLQNLIRRQVVYSIYKVGFTTKMEQAPTLLEKAQTNNLEDNGQFSNFSNDPYKGGQRQEKVSAISAPKNDEGEKIGRNDLCPCGSGKKYKKCHGA